MFKGDANAISRKLMTTDTPPAELCAKLAALLVAAKRPLFFTGAGISTESGLPDFRSPSGFWRRHQPIAFDEFLSSEDKRRLSWLRNRDIIARIDQIQPNIGHTFIARYMARCAQAQLITQNVDGLHQRTAPAERILELHGNATYAACLTCGARHDPVPFHRAAASGAQLPACTECTGLVKSATISFGQQMPIAATARAYQMAATCDFMLVAGSSLVVHPAADLPGHAVRAGATLAILNREPTPFDHVAHIVMHGELGDIFEKLDASIARPP